MKFYKIYLNICLIALLLIPSTDVLAHTHEYGESQYHHVEYLKEDPFSSGCATQYTYHSQTCQTCGYSRVYIHNSKKMNHHYQNNTCIYCGMFITKNN